MSIATEFLRHPGRTGAAENLATHVQKADVVVSGLPWALFPVERPERILDQVCEIRQQQWTSYTRAEAAVLAAAIPR